MPRIPPRVNTLALEWAKLEANAIPPNLEPERRRMARRLFYAGATALRECQNGLLDHAAADPTEDEQNAMEALDQELIRFGEDVKAGRA